MNKKELNNAGSKAYKIERDKGNIIDVNCAVAFKLGWEAAVKLFNTPVKCPLCRRGMTAKQSEAEDYVVAFIKDHDRPPTYREVAKNYGIQVNTAFVRLKYSRNLMKCKQ